jgi:hypothetical protein
MPMMPMMPILMMLLMLMVMSGDRVFGFRGDAVSSVQCPRMGESDWLNQSRRGAKAKTRRRWEVVVDDDVDAAVQDGECCCWWRVVCLSRPVVREW